MRLTARSLLVAAAALLPSALEAQTAEFRPRPSILFEPPAPTPLSSDTLNLPSTYWKEGALIVGIPFLLIGGAAGAGLCETGEGCGMSMLGGAVIGAVIGATTGAMIGGLFDKPRP